jgi:hypothetical protein
VAAVGQPALPEGRDTIAGVDLDLSSQATIEHGIRHSNLATKMAVIVPSENFERFTHISSLVNRRDVQGTV